MTSLRPKHDKEVIPWRFAFTVKDFQVNQIWAFTSPNTLGRQHYIIKSQLLLADYFNIIGRSNDALICQL